MDFHYGQIWRRNPGNDCDTVIDSGSSNAYSRVLPIHFVCLTETLPAVSGECGVDTGPVACWISYARFSPLSIFGNARGTALHDFVSNARYWSKAMKGHPGFWSDFSEVR
jgi:hypothetical protein